MANFKSLGMHSKGGRQSKILLKDNGVLLNQRIMQMLFVGFSQT